MQKFLLILRESGTKRKDLNTDNGPATDPAMTEWIHSLTRSGNYCSGEPVGLRSQYVGGGKMSKSKTLYFADDRILRFDTITAENIEQAISIAGTCPPVEQGLAEIELRTILALIR